MNIKIKNLFLIGGIVVSVILSSCKKEDDNTSGSGTNPPSNETGTFTDSRDSKTYKWVKIGEQVWMSENLNYTGSEIKHITDNDEWENNSDYDGWSYFHNSDSLGKIYGALYQWEAAKKACPAGWHLPTDEEWMQLENYLIENGYSYDGVIGNSYIAKSLSSTTGWSMTSGNQGAVGNSDFPEYRNKTGFSALPGGCRDYRNGRFFNLSRLGFWWSATEYDSDNIYTSSLDYSTTEIYHYNYLKSSGFPVRCVRD